MKTVSILCFDKRSSATMSETILVSDDSVAGKEVKADKERIKTRLDEIFANVPFTNWYYEAESMDDLTEEERKIFEELDVDII